MVGYAETENQSAWSISLSIMVQGKIIIEKKLKISPDFAVYSNLKTNLVDPISMEVYVLILWSENRNTA